MPGRRKELLGLNSSFLDQIVPKDSATVAGYEAQAIPADHVGMVRFDTNAEPGDVRIKVVLERWTEALKKTGKATPVTASLLLPGTHYCPLAIRHVPSIPFRHAADHSLQGINIHQEVQRMLGGKMIGYIAGSHTFNSTVYNSDKRGSG
ncbi:hypothetical protein V8F33_012437 [Rhypophila sp. PSN 637]